MKRYDVFGIGSAIVDFLIEVSEEELAKMGLRKGEMNLIDENKSKEILAKLNKQSIKISPGGSGANTIAGVASLGGSAAFCGKIGNDQYGKAYEKSSSDYGIHTKLKKHNSKMTGHAITFITPDRERTFATHLGAAMHLGKEDLDEEGIAASKILHIEGYQIDDPGLRQTAMHAIIIAKNNGTLISIDLADPGVVRRNLNEFKKIVEEHADIVFANEQEARAFTGKENGEEALSEISKFCDIAVVKLGEKGSLIKSCGKVHKIPAVKVNAVDTTGAGDMYAAGVLFGIANSLPIDRAGRIGSWAASKVVSQVGARLATTIKDEAKNIK